MASFFGSSLTAVTASWAADPPVMAASRAEVNGGESHFSVIALGKLGGKELNYSSDIDLLDLGSRQCHSRGPDYARNSQKVSLRTGLHDR